MTTILDSLLIHPQTKALLRSYVKRPSHALMLLGAAGSGKKTTAEALSVDILNIAAGSALSSYPFFFHVTLTDKKEISIDQIRDLISKLKLKTPGTQSIRRVVFIENADAMSLEAQNALLKMLEEPGEDTAFVLTTLSDRSVLPTIGSRAQHIYIHPVSLSSAARHYQDQYPTPKVEEAWQLSRGNVGLLHALLSEAQAHELKEAVKEAKSLLRLGRYERLLALDSLSRDKTRLNLFLDALHRVLSALHSSALAKNRSAQAAKLLAARKLVNELMSALESSAAPRLVVLKLVMKLNV